MRRRKTTVVSLTLARFDSYGHRTVGLCPVLAGQRSNQGNRAVKSKCETGESVTLSVGILRERAK
jgi:hypothetical protein